MPKSASPGRSRLAAALTTLSLCCLAPAWAAPAQVTECDRQASHPEDPDRVVAGLATRDVDLAAAVAACESDLDAAPDNARLRYQLARVLFYAGEHERAMQEMQRAADDGHRQAQFVFGVFIVRERPLAPRDICLAEHYWRLSAIAGREAAPVNYALQALRGRFDGCEERATDAELQVWLTAALAGAPQGYPGYYQRLVIEDLLLRLSED
jgi:tetratricopeptide (TPR) repeat protein